MSNLSEDKRARRDESPPAVWIVILNYRAWRQTLDCLASVEALDYPNYRVLVIDNASQDGSVEQIRHALPDVEILQLDENYGFGGGNNPGIRLALAGKADYVWLLNNDTVVDPAALTALVDRAEDDLTLGAVGSVLYEMERPDEIQAWGGASLNLWTGHTRNLRSASGKLSFLTGASLLLRCRTLKEVALFDERFFFLWEDADLSFRLRQHGWGIAVSEASKVWHVGGGTAAPLSPARMEFHAEGVVLMLRKHAPVPWLAAFSILGYYALAGVRQSSWSLFYRALRGWCHGWRK